MYAFDYHRPGTLAEVEAMLAGDADAKLVAGGHTLLPTMKARLASPSALIDLGALDVLRGIRREGEAIRIGAMTRHADVAASDLIRAVMPALSTLAQHIGDPSVRNRGTIGGSVANNDPAADYPAAVLALGATVSTTRREIVAEEFFTGLYETALEEGEVLTAVTFPIASKAAYVKFLNPASRYALVGAFAALVDGEPRVAITGAGAGGVFRFTAMEEALRERFHPDAVSGLVADPAEMMSDMHADADYRAHLVGVIARRAVAAAVGVPV